jgi:hypothetical protein
MQAQKLDHALLSVLAVGRDPRTDHPIYLTDSIRVDVEFRAQPTEADRLAIARLGGVCRDERADRLTVIAPALSVAPLTDLPTVAKLHFGGARGK